MKLAKRLDAVSESVTLKLNASVKQLKKEGVDIINLTAGEPDFPTFEAIKKSAIEAIQRNESKYSPVPGLMELREEIVERQNRCQPQLTRDHPWTSQNTVVTNGAKHSLFNAFMAILDPGDRVLIPSPYWLSYPEMVLIVGAEPRVVRPGFEAEFKLTPTVLKNAIEKEKPKAILINSPSNPSGVVYTREELRALGEVMIESSQEFWVVSDEIYDRITFDAENPYCSFLEACAELEGVEDLRARTITINGLSKSAAVTGWRIGWAIAAEPVIQAMSKLQGQSTAGVNSVAQWAGISAFSVPDEEYHQRSQSYLKRRDVCLEILKKSCKIKVIPPKGAFYAFVGVEDAFLPGEDSVGFAERLLQEKQVAVVPGTPFGEPGFIRLSFATDESSLQEGCDRLVQFVEKNISG